MNCLSSHSVAKEFHYERNAPLKPEDFTLKSGKKIWWRCSKNPEHEWEARVSSRTGGTGCPFCSGNKVSKQNRLSNHLVSSEFDLDKNYPLTPNNTAEKSSKKVWWKCKNGHSFKSRISDRIGKNSKCPFCQKKGKKVSNYENNLSLYLLSEEFHPTKNYPLTPEDFTPKSNKKVWWRCSVEHSHEWEASPNNRVRLNSGCPHCSNNGTSKPEQEILEFITYLGLYSIHRYRLDKVESDIFIPEKNLAIEHNGLYWHSSLFKDKNYHYTKYKHFRDRGIQLIQIWEDEWRDKQDVVKSILQQKLGLSPVRIYARKCSFVEGDFSQFIEDNHISGNVRAQRYLGLEYQGELVAAMSLRKPFHKKWASYTEIARFCTKQNTAVVGGLSKLLKRTSGPLLTYADCRFGSGDSYETVGFKRDGHTGIGFEWVDFKNKGNRYNRFMFKAGNGKSQREVAEENGVIKLYNVGNYRMLMEQAR